MKIWIKIFIDKRIVIIGQEKGLDNVLLLTCVMHLRNTSWQFQGDTIMNILDEIFQTWFQSLTTTIVDNTNCS